MKLSEWAKQKGISYRTAWRMWKTGKLPVPAEQLPTGTVVVYPPPEPSSGGAALYARVSSSDQKADLDRQLARLTEYAVQHKLPIVDAVKEIGSGLNGHRKGLIKLLRNPKVKTIIVEHRDRLTRFGFEFIEAALAAQGREIIVVDPGEVMDDIVRDLHDGIVSLCARLYGRRSARNRARKAIEALQCER
jgi:predicted site-specific integrase-resolvase